MPIAASSGSDVVLLVRSSTVLTRMGLKATLWLKSRSGCTRSLQVGFASVQFAAPIRAVVHASEVASLLNGVIRRKSAYEAAARSRCRQGQEGHAKNDGGVQRAEGGVGGPEGCGVGQRQGGWLRLGVSSSTPGTDVNRFFVETDYVSVTLALLCNSLTSPCPRLDHVLTASLTLAYRRKTSLCCR